MAHTSESIFSAPATACTAAGSFASPFSAAFRRKLTAERMAPGTSSAQPSATFAFFSATSRDSSASPSSSRR